MSGEKILIVDDNADTITILSAILTKGGYTLSVARDGEEALRKAEEAPPALILLDLMMPKMDGFEVCEKIRDHPILRKTIVFFLTARGDSPSKARAIALEVKEYIVKPFTPREILEKVRYHLSVPDPPILLHSFAFVVGLVSRLAYFGSWMRLRSARRRFSAREPSVPI